MSNVWNVEIKKIKFFLIFGCVFILTACHPLEDSFGIPDPLANDNINQFIRKGPDWKQIAQDRTLFELGEADSEPFDTLNRGIYTYFQYNYSYGTFPAIDGSTVCIPMAAEFVWQFTNLSEHNGNIGRNETFGFLSFSTTPNAYNRIINGGQTNGVIHQDISVYNTNEYCFRKRPDIVLATYPSSAELEMAANAGVELVIEPICFDAFVFITRKDNPVESLTVEQIQKIYSGKITNWKYVGGEDVAITAYQREPNSGSQTAMEEWVMEGIPMMKPPMGQIVEAMGQLVRFVAGYENNAMSLGYTYKYYVDRLYTSPDIKILKVNGIMPSDENIRNNSYAFVAPYNAVIRSTDTNEVGGRFLNWILSDEGQASITQAGYVSLRDIAD